MRMIPTSTTAFATAAAGLLLAPALSIGSSHPDHDIMRVHNLKLDDSLKWNPAQDTAASAAPTERPLGHETVHEEVRGQILTHQPQGGKENPTAESVPLGGVPELQPELKRSEVGVEGNGAVLLRRETSAAPTIYGVSIWLILAWLALLYFMYKTGSMF